MAKYKIRFERNDCIGAATCVAANPKNWSIKEIKADLTKSSEVEPEIFERIIEEEELKEMLDAAQGCPVNVIHIFNLETGEQLI